MVTQDQDMPVFDDDPNTPDTPSEYRRVAVYPPPGQTHIVTPHGLVYTTKIEGGEHIWVRKDDLPFLLSGPPSGPGCTLHPNYDDIDHRTLMPVAGGAPLEAPPVVGETVTVRTTAPRPQGGAAVPAPAAAPVAPAPPPTVASILATEKDEAPA